MAKPLIVNIPHELGRAEAHRRLSQGFGRIREQIAGNAVAFEEHWEGERLHFKAGALGQTIAGRVDILDDGVRIEVELPWLLASLGNSLQAKLKKEGALLLEKK